jgi:hypothetical protein
MRLNRKNFLHRLLIMLVVLLTTGHVSTAQPFNNEWIDFSKTYYKFKVGADGLYRIPQSVLNTNGMGQVPAEHFRLYRNGEEVTIFTSVGSGALPADGYIEFLGFANDGIPDRPLYRDPQFQHRTRYNLHSDTAVYFLTVESVLPNKRFNTVVNNVAGNTLPAEPYFIHRLARDFKERINNGFAADLEQYVYSSSYDRGEFWSSNDIRQRITRTDNQTNLRAATSGPDASIQFGAFGNTTKTRRVRVGINNTTLYENSMNFFSDLVASATVPLSLLSSGTAGVQFTNVQPPAPATGPDPYLDRLTVSFYELVYPRLFNFNNQRLFSFELEAKTQGYYLEITNFSSGGVAPVLYDLENQERYVANTQVAGVFRFAIPGSANRRRFTMVSQEQIATYPTIVNQLTPRSFTDFSVSENQGNYLIISHPNLFTSPSGNNPVEQYSQYRRSAAGGGYNTIVYNVQELTDQFGLGISGHPSAIRNFIRFARATFAQEINYILIIGKGINYTDYKSNPTTERPQLKELNLVPTFGYPGSDNLLGAADLTKPVSNTPIGRISAINGSEVENYLEKVREYEDVITNNAHNIQDRLWMKSALHVTGATDALLAVQLCNSMQNLSTKLTDTLTGAKVSVICKTVGGQQDQGSSGIVKSMFNSGMGLLTYFGHSSANTLEFSIENPEAYENQGKYPIFSVNGCYAGDMFRFNVQRFSDFETLTERFVLTRQKGSIAFLASTHFGVVNYLSTYLNELYGNSGVRNYGESLGILNVRALNDMLSRYSQVDFLARLHAEQITIHGDPALKMYTQAKPDYVVEQQTVQVEPSFISVADQSFKVKVAYYNLGKAINDSIRIEIRRVRPDESIQTVYTEKRIAANYSDSIELDIPVLALLDKGQNQLIVSVDTDGAVDEMSESNNTVTKTFFIYEDEVSPVFPYNFSIISNQNQKFIASTANPFSLPKQYVFEIDTSALFNSPLLKSVQTTTAGGIIEFSPSLNFSDSVVYFWRTALSPENGEEIRWNKFSFLFKDDVNEGFNQSNTFQHTESTNKNIRIDSAARNWKYENKLNDVLIRQAVYPTGSDAQSDYSIIANNSAQFGAGCDFDEIIFNVFDANTFRLWQNDFSGSTGLYQSKRHVCGTGRQFNFAYNLKNAADRKKAMDFIDMLPDGSTVIVKGNSSSVDNQNTYSHVWRGDTALYGSGNSLYHKLLLQGVADLDSFNRPRAFAFVFKKNAQSEFATVSKYTQGIYDRLVFSVNPPSPLTSGSVVSPKFGPAKSWKELRWSGRDISNPVSDNIKIEIIGIDTNDIETVVKEVGPTENVVDLLDINPQSYPFIKLKLINNDSLNGNPFQLDYWRVIYSQVPEGAVAPNLFIQSKDTVDIGEPLEFAVAFKNISNIPFDSLKVQLILTDQNNLPHELPTNLLKPLIAGDTIIFRYTIDTKKYPGNNTFFVNFNPSNHQPEQYSFNNFIYKSIYVRGDKKNPLLDVTFDGTHILNGDIVSAKPLIQIKLKDESKFLLLKDTSLLSIQVKFPDGSIKRYRYDGDTVQFRGATDPLDNTATIEFKPSFMNQINEDGYDNYELTIVGEDVSGNSAGTVGYSINFLVVNKPMISNLLNYPNPFTTSTAFVFTLTGSEIPTNFKIQIMTVTGKIVKEITALELGPIRIGRNITEYTWDGTDQFGQRLANGVYLYRVVSSLNGKKLDKFKTDNENTDKFFTRGYGKMYLMR